MIKYLVLIASGTIVQWSSFDSLNDACNQAKDGATILKLEALDVSCTFAPGISLNLCENNTIDIRLKPPEEIKCKKVEAWEETSEIKKYDGDGNMYSKWGIFYVSTETVKEKEIKFGKEKVR